MWPPAGTPTYLDAVTFWPDDNASTDVEQFVKAFQEKWIKDRSYVYGLLGREADFDKEFVSTLGPVRSLTLEDIFGY